MLILQFLKLCDIKKAQRQLRMPFIQHKAFLVLVRRLDILDRHPAFPMRPTDVQTLVHDGGAYPRVRRSVN